MQLRHAIDADVETLFDIRTSVQQNHLSREQLTELGITPLTLTEALNQSPCAWIVEIDGVAAGFSMVDSETGEVFALFVRPEFEGRGVGKLLLQAAESKLFKSHDLIWLVTDKNEQVRANGFYQRLGWYLAEQVDDRDARYEKHQPS